MFATVAVTPGQSFAVTIGQGGNAGEDILPPDDVFPGDGGDTVIAGVLTAEGGAHGNNRLQSAPTPEGGDGAAGPRSGMDGGPGLASDFDGTTRTYGSGGAGAVSVTTGTPGAQSTLPNQGGGGNGGLGAEGFPGQAGRAVARYRTGTLTATGGAITTSGEWTVHTFTGDGTFTVTG
ncbi:hypothetical protein LRS10_09400 [Phenylobacterium sp. J426]|nr:hypothetical protein [Phenylobacterium sp. J426]MCR5874358.1 hypothetical protein [Phenylobacterium sp. J426]